MVLVSYTAKKDKIYTISFDTENTGISCYLNLVDASKLQKITSNTNFTMDGQKHSFVVKALEDVEVSNISLVARAQATSTTGSGYLSNFQIEEGSIATNYVEHKSQTFTFPLGNEKLMLGDYLADDGIHHVRGQIVLDGTEPWQQYGNNVYFQDINRIHGKPTSGNIIGGFCTHTDVTTRTNMQYNSPSGVGLFVSNLISYWGLSEVSVNAWETWLSTRNVTIEYELAEEVIVPYTQAQQEVYNQIKQSLSYEEQTNIIGSSDGSNPIFSVEAYQSTKLLLENFESRLTLVEG